MAYDNSLGREDYIAVHKREEMMRMKTIEYEPNKTSDEFKRLLKRISKFQATEAYKNGRTLTIKIKGVTTGYVRDKLYATWRGNRLRFKIAGLERPQSPEVCIVEDNYLQFKKPARNLIIDWEEVEEISG